MLESSEGRTAPDFSLKSLASSPGRMDLVARCLIASFYTLEGPRRNASFTVILEGPPDPPVALTFDGERLVEVPVGEVQAARVIYDALSGCDITGVVAERKGFEGSVMRYRERGYSLFYLHEEGMNSSRVSYPKDSVFVLGDQKGLDAQSECIMDRLGAKRVSLGPYPYLASHCITVMNNELDQF